ncbi:glutathione degradosome [Tuber magnatum]|uniref:Glutathione degradosome n=1 Tax=Tuber magnatum TaxID=42249 RepID=A0A317SXN5_9PEZI|nr:glutathione degradosome [Tuber magnatum]
MSGLRPLSPANGGRADTPLPRFLDNSGLPIDPPVREAREGGGAVEEEMPTLLHRVKHDGSILSLCVSDELIYAGSQSGEIMVWSLETFQLVRSVQAHQGSVLCLYLADHQSVLFSSAGDAIINVWDAKTFENLYSIYSTFDVGDVFCVVYSSALQTTYFGAQNTSIQWYDLKAKDLRPRPTLTSHPSHRNHRFFDSKGPGGRTTPRPASKVVPPSSRLLEVDPENIVQYAHYGYVYCMLLITLPSGWEIGGDGGEMLLSGGGDGVVKLWTINPATSAITSAMSLSAGDSGVLSMAINDTMLYCGLTDGEICIWDLDTRQLIRSLRTHCEDVLTMAVMGNCIFSGSASGYSRKWNQRFEHMSRWQSHSGLILASAATKRHGRLIYITGGNDNCVAIWDASALAQAESQTLRSQNDQLLCSLSKLVSFRTVSSDPSYAEDCRRGATYLKQLFKRYGATATLLPSEGGRNPIVHARFGGCGTKGRNKGKTILFYGHYDVIPASESAGAGWQTRPFELTGMNGYLYGRGVSDNKGPCLAALFAAGELVQEQELDADIMFLIEGEEESGSRGFVDAVRRNKELIGDVDWILLANSYWLDDDVPCLTYGLRGVIHATVVVESDKPDLHSGVEGSRLNREPTIDLVNLLAKLTSSDGKVLIPGFSEPVRPVTPAEEEMYTAITNAIVNKPDWSHLTAAQIKDHLMSKWRFPSLTIHKVSVSGPSNATIIPRAASASISLRIVPDQELSVIKDQLVSYLRSEYSSFNSNNKLNITIDHEAEPWLGDPENDAFRTLEEAVMDVWSEGNEERVRPLYIREGGSIPTARFLEKEFGAPAAHLPCGQASDQAHLDDERLRLVNLYKSKAILKRVFKELPRK